MASLYAKYLMERTNDLIIEKPQGYVTYRYMNNDKTVYIIDIYIIPEFRRGNLASSLADEVVAEAKQRGCVDLIGTVMPSAKNSTTSLKVLMGYGMTLNSAANDVIVFRKEL